MAVDPFMIKTVAVTSIAVPLVAERLSRHFETSGATAAAIFMAGAVAAIAEHLIFLCVYTTFELGAFYGLAMSFFALVTLAVCPVVFVLSRILWTMFDRQSY